MDGIFISYRRDDSAGYAGRLYDRLAAHFGAERVFMDVEGIDPGTDFVDAIERAVTSCKVLIVLIGHEWLEIDDGSGHRRLDDPNDFIRIETSTALKRDIRVVPVLLDGALMPRADQLPDELLGLSRRQAIEIRHKQWESSTGNLIDALEKIYLSEGVNAAQPSKTKQSSASKISSEPSNKKWIIFTVLGLVCVIMLGFWFASPTQLKQPVSQQKPKLPPTIAAVKAPATSTLTPPQPSVPDQPVVQGRLEVEPLQIDYGKVMLGSTAQATLTLTNSGNAIIPIPGLLLADEVTNSLSIDHDCADNLSPNESCVVELRFAPSSEGQLDTELKITGPDDSPVTVSLSAIVRALPAVITAAPSSPVVAPEPVPGSVVKPITKPIAPPISKVVIPKIIHFTSKVSGKRARLCYEVERAQQLVIEPRPGQLNNLQKDCVIVVLEGTTAFKLVAQSGNQKITDSLVATPEKTAESPPQPVVIPAKPAPDVIIDSKLPNVGDKWIYKIRGRWASSPKHTIEVAVLSVKDNAVQETLTQVDSNARKQLGQRFVRGPVAYVTQSNQMGTEFSPYLYAFDELDANSEWRGIPTPDTNNFWTGWNTQGEADDTETITVPAGTFNALKITLQSSRNSSGSQTEASREPVRVTYRIWYAKEVKRFVKMVRNTISASGQAIDTDTFELVSYQQK